MPHRMKVNCAGPGACIVVCPDEVEKDIRDYLQPPLHLVAWAILEACAATRLENVEAVRNSANNFGEMAGMYTSILDLPMDTVEESPGVWVVNHCVWVTLLDHPELKQ